MANPAAKPPAPPVPANAPAAAAPSAVPARKFNPLYVIIPLVVLVLVAAGVAPMMLRDWMEARQQGAGGESSLGIVDGARGPQKDRKSREVKVGENPAPVPATEVDELSGLGKKKKPPPPKPTAAVTPAERAWRAVKNDYDRLEARNETTARRYRMRILTLEDRKTSAAEPAFVKEAGALEEELRGELTKPENQ